MQHINQKIKTKGVNLLFVLLAGGFAYTFYSGLSPSSVLNAEVQPRQEARNIINAKDSLETPDAQIDESLFQIALNGYNKLKAENKIKNPLLTIVDFSKPSTEKRMFIIDMVQNKVLINTLVAHGKNSGEKMATQFSNLDASHQSSLGFYLTGKTYEGNNGYSLKLTGLEPGINDRAESRAIVMHGASYVSKEVVNRTGRLGRSWGCPAVSLAEHKKIIDLIKNRSCLFIYAPQKGYLANSSFIKDFSMESGSL